MNSFGKSVRIVIAVYAAFSLLFAIFVGFAVYSALSTISNEDWSHGAKPVIEKLWCGKVGCMGN